MKIVYTLAIFLCFLTNSFAQIGINTSTPQSNLHVNGTLQITKELRVSSDNSLKGNAGDIGQVLISRGKNEHPIWKDLEEIVVLPVINVIAQYQANENLISNDESTLQFNSFPFLDSENINYNTSTGEFTILKSGYYRIYATTTSQASGQLTAGHVRTFFTKDDQLFLAKSTYHHEYSQIINHSIAGLEYFNANDQLQIKYFRTPSHRLTMAYLSIIYTGE